MFRRTIKGLSVLIIALIPMSCGNTAGNDMKKFKALVIGQSNAACYAETKYKAIDKRVLAVYEDQKVRYFDPVRGCGTHEWGQGSIWGILGDKIAQSNQYYEISFSVIAKGGTSIKHWDRLADTDLTSAGIHAASKEMEHILRFARDSGDVFTHIIWMQGETDGLSDMPHEQYTQHLVNIFNHIREFSDAPIFVGLTSLCFEGVKQNVRIGQFNAVSNNQDMNIRFGADTDLRAPSSMRDYMGDGCHLSESGQYELAQAWYEAITRGE